MARQPRKPNLEIEVVYVPGPDYEEHLNGALDVLADALAERLIAKARQQVADELGVRPEELVRDRQQLDLELWVSCSLEQMLTMLAQRPTSIS